MKKFKIEDTVMLLIDHQPGTIGMSDNRSAKIITSRARALARVGKALKIPIVLTTSLEDTLGTTIKDLQELLPDEYKARVERHGITSAWDDDNFKAAVRKAAGKKKNIVMAGLTNEVCTIWSAISMVEDGYDVQVVIDGGGSPSEIAEDVARKTWESHGVRTTTINQFVSELVFTWSSPEGQLVMPLMVEEVFSLIGQK